MHPINSYSTIPQQDGVPSLRLLAQTLDNWVARTKSPEGEVFFPKGVVLHPNGQCDYSPKINLQPRWELFENLSMLLTSGYCCGPEKLEYPYCVLWLTDPLTRLSRTVKALWQRKAIKDFRTHNAYVILQRDIAIVRLWLKEVKSLGKIYWNLHKDDRAQKHPMEFDQIKEVAEKLRNWNLCSMPRNFINYNSRLLTIKQQALDLAEKRLADNLPNRSLSEPVVAP